MAGKRRQQGRFSATARPLRTPAGLLSARTLPIALLGCVLALGVDLAPAMGQASAQSLAPGVSVAADDAPADLSLASTDPVERAGSGSAQRGVDREGPIPLAPYLGLPDLVTELSALTAMPDATSTALPTVDAGQVLASGFVRPVDGIPSSPFGLRVHPITGALKLHSGLDLAAPCNTPVVAAADGVVQWAGVAYSYGGRVVLDHPSGLRTTYNHLNAYAVSPGMAVKQGQIIGFVGSTGFSTGCHLHFEVVGPQGFADPAPYLEFAPAPKAKLPAAITPIDTTSVPSPSASATPTTAIPPTETAAGTPTESASPSSEATPTTTSAAPSPGETTPATTSPPEPSTPSSSAPTPSESSSAPAPTPVAPTPAAPTPPPSPDPTPEPVVTPTPSAG